MCGVFNFRFVYTCRILRYLPCRPHITHMTFLHHSLTHITHLTYSLTYTHIHIYTHSLTLTHSYLLTHTHSHLLTHSLTYLYLLKNTHTHSIILAYIHTHIHSIPPFLCGSRSQYTYPTTRTPWRPSGSASFAWKAWGNVYY